MTKAQADALIERTDKLFEYQHVQAKAFEDFIERRTSLIEQVKNQLDTHQREVTGHLNDQDKHAENQRKSILVIEELLNGPPNRIEDGLRFQVAAMTDSWKKITKFGWLVIGAVLSGVCLTGADIYMRHQPKQEQQNVQQHETR